MSDRSLVRFVRHLGSVPRIRTGSWAMVGQDGGQSIDLGGATLFVFSDTLVVPLTALAADPPCVFLANAAATGVGRGLREALEGLRYFCGDDGLPREILPAAEQERAAGLRFWPEHGVLVDGTVWLYYLGVQATDPSDIWGFRNLGAGLALLDPGSGTAEPLRPRGDWRLWRPTSDDLHFGVQVVRRDDELYVFGSQRRGVDVWGFVGRVPVGDVAEPAAYTYLRPGEGRWVAGLEHAGSLGPCASEYSVAFNAHLGRYLMVYVDAFTKELMLRSADDLAGPYSTPASLGRVPHMPSSELVYLGFQHPGFARDGGRRVYVSYCQPSFVPASLCELCFR